MERKSAGKILPRPRGEYDPEAVYRMLDMVTYKNCLYMTKVENVNGIEPSRDDTENWLLVIDGLLVEENASTSVQSANSAAQSENNASVSAENALQSASAAYQYESNAAQSENNASESAENAAQSASEASVSATNAAQSENNASVSAENALQSATNAAQSETNVEMLCDDINSKCQEVIASMDEFKAKLEATTLSINVETGNLEYDSNAYAFSVNEETGNLECEVIE